MNPVFLITIDGGTTNTRAALWKDDEVIAVAAREVGAQNTATSASESPLKTAVKSCIDEIMEKGAVTFSDISGVVAAGMITSNAGLVEIPHLIAPVDAKTLAAHIKPVLLEDVCPLPINFIPGVKNNVPEINTDTFEQMDMMRGEEVEAFAILKDHPATKSTLLILPGSHNKFVSVDENGAITGCLTTISGELLSAITRHTILAKSVGQKFAAAESYDKEMVLRGAKTAGANGLGRACFSGRILGTFVTNDEMQIANFLLGAVLQGDIDAFKNSSALILDADADIIIAGKNPLRQALVDILHANSPECEVKEYHPAPGKPMSGVGAKYLYELYKTL